MTNFRTPWSFQRVKKSSFWSRNAAHKDYLRSVVSQAGDLAFCFQQETTCLDNLFQLDPALIVMGSFPQDRSIRFMNALRAIDCELPVIMISEDPAVRSTLQSTRSATWRSSISRGTVRPWKPRFSLFYPSAKKDEQWNRLPFIVGKNPDVVKMKTLLPELGRSTENVFIRGEKGVGKELLARTIHVHSKNDDMFIKIDAPALAVDDSNCD